MTEAESTAHNMASERANSDEVSSCIRAYYQAARDVRRGVCLLNAAKYDEATDAFSQAAARGIADASLPSYLAACLLGQGKPSAAVDQFARAAEQDAQQPAAQIRHALALWKVGNAGEAVRTLRSGVHDNPECAELHFQLGTLLTSLEEHDEAELRFTQAVNIDENHTDARVSLALCCGLRGCPTEAHKHLQRAQAGKPHSPRIGLLLAQATKALRQQGHAVGIRACMPEDSGVEDPRGVAELSRLIEDEPDFVDAFLSIPLGQVDEQVFAMLLTTLQNALERQPQQAELHYHCARVLERLGRHQDAIDADERAVEINPRFTRALIGLALLYQRTDRAADAATRLEQAIEAGAKYADIYYLLGNLYRDQGDISGARQAYGRALAINDRYEAAHQALASLPG